MDKIIIAHKNQTACNNERKNSIAVKIWLHLQNNAKFNAVHSCIEPMQNMALAMSSLGLVTCPRGKVR